MSEVNTVTYFCPEPCEGLETEQPRDTGEEYFGPPRDDDSASSQTDQRYDVGVTAAKAKPEPGTVYSIPEACFAGMTRVSHDLARCFVCLKVVVFDKSLIRLWGNKNDPHEQIL